MGDCQHAYLQHMGCQSFHVNYLHLGPCCPQGIGDLTLAYQCFKLSLAFNNDHAEAYNNLAVLELRKGRIEQVSTPSSLVCIQFL